MQTKTKSKLASAGLALMMAFQATGAQADGLPVPDMNSDFVRGAVESALDSAKCKIVKKDKRLGVKGDDRHQNERGGASCHNSRDAIDFFPDHVKCDDAKLKGSAKLKHITDNLPTWKLPLLTVCGPYGDGPCLKAHNGHIHIGARETLGCATPY